MSNVNGKPGMIPTESETTRTVGNFSHGSRETPATSASPMEADRSEKARSHTSNAHVTGESDSSIVPEKQANKGSVPLPAESAEGRGLTKENTGQSLLDRTQCRNADGTPFVPRSRGLLGVREAARKDKKLRFTSLLHHITPELLRASFFELKKQAAPGVDGETWRDYAIDFERRIDDLDGRIHRGAYRAKPSKRTYIPKPDGRMRPLGIAALEDKIVQQAARTVLECIYEQDFLGFSYGFRPGRSQHRALDALYVGITKRKVNWIIDADIRGFFDNITKFGLELHPEKTRLIEFGRYAEERRAKRGDGPPETFDFLGFTHISGKTRRGDFTIHRKTSRKKFQAALPKLKEELSRRRHDDLTEVGAWLQSVFRGWCQYYAVPGNYARLRQFREALQVMWYRTLRRRSQRGRRLTWEKFSQLSRRWLPTPKILHPYPNARFAGQHPR